jgi:hypothetical protein
MKKIYILTLLLFSLKNLNAQVVFCPPGAEWTYNFTTYWTMPAVSNEKITYVGDSIAGSDTLKKLLHSKSFTYGNYFKHCSPTFIKQKGDTIFFWNSCTQNNWQILYNFAVQPGQAWYNTLLVKNNPAATSSFTVAVMFVDTALVNGFVLKELTLQYTRSYSTLMPVTEPPVKVTERLGCAKFLFNFYANTATDQDQVYRNLCYKDNQMGQLQFTPFPCDFSNPVGMDEYLSTTNHLNIFPNPGSDEIKLESEFKTGHYNIEFTDLSGRIIKQAVIDNDGSLNIRDLEEGLYFITAYSSDGDLLGRSKFLKER